MRAAHQLAAVAEGERHDLGALELPFDVADDRAGHIVDHDDEKVGNLLAGFRAIEITARCSLAYMGSVRHPVIWLCLPEAGRYRSVQWFR
jgi:hypothetical protein